MHKTSMQQFYDFFRNADFVHVVSSSSGSGQRVIPSALVAFWKPNFLQLIKSFCKSNDETIAPNDKGYRPMIMLYYLLNDENGDAVNCRGEKMFCSTVDIPKHGVLKCR